MAIFRQQARDVARRITPTVIDSGKAPDLSHWIGATATAIKPLMLEMFQRGILHTAAKLGLKREPALGPAAQAVLAASGGRYELGNDRAFGPRKGVILSAERASETVSMRDMLPCRLPVAKAGGVRYSLPAGGMRTVIHEGGPAPRPYFSRKQVFKAAGLGSAFDIFNPRVLDAVDAACMVLCRETLATATTDLDTALKGTRDALKEGLKRGDALVVLSKKIQEIFASPARAQTIAITESVRAMSGGRLLAAVDSGLVSEKEWVCNPESCEQCFELDGKRVKLHEPFIVIGHGPYAIVQFPPLHPRCICDFSEVFSEGKHVA